MTSAASEGKDRRIDGPEGPVLYSEVRVSGCFVTERSLRPTDIDLRALAAPEVAVQRVFEPALLEAEAEGLRLAGPVEFDGRLIRRGERYQLTGKARGTVELACSRCLEPFDWPVDAEVDLTYVPDRRVPVPADAEVELQDDDLSTAYYHDHVLDLAGMLREQFHLALPMQPLCREECRGLCPQCGTNRNAESCDCRTTWEDPRLAALRSLNSPRRD